MQARHYSRAPIVEAVIDLRVSLPADISMAKIATIHREIESEYPSIEPLFTSAFTLQPGPEIKVDASNKQVGFQFANEKKQFVMQATEEGFSFSHLAPYSNWDTFYGEARKLWMVYLSVCRPLNVRRAAVRFINRLELPGPDIDFKDYLSTYPEIAPGLPQGVSSFAMQLQIPQTEPQCMLIINELFAPPMDANETTLPVILDLDLYREQSWQSADDDDIWAFLSQLRDVKNRVFNESITDRTKGLID